MTMLEAHAFGARYDLPIPLALFVIGGAVVVVLSFLLVLPRTVRSDGDTEQLPDRAPSTSLSGPWAAASLVVLMLLTACGLLGSNEVAENILPTVFWLVVWIAVPLSCGLLGDWTRKVNPFANLVRLVDRPRVRTALLRRAEPFRYPRRLGWWPAVVLYFALACGELIFNLTATLPHVIAAGFVVYAVANLFSGVVYGPAWLERGEVFSVLFATWGRLGYFRFGAEGRRGFAGGLVVPFERSVSRVTFVMLLLISVNFDGLLATPRWSSFERNVAGIHSGSIDALRTASFLILIAVVCGVFGSFAVAAARAGGRRSSFRDSLAGLLPSLLPIAFGYLLAHNAQYVLVNSQLLAPLIGNPTGQDSWPIHLPYPFNDDFEPHATFLPSAVYWYVGVLAIVAAHVVAVLIAHRYLANRSLEASRARASEYPWLVAMVAYTVFSLILIAQPLTKEKDSASQPAESRPPTATGTMST